MIAFICSSVMWEISELPLQATHGLPACSSSIGPLRKANPTSAFTSTAKSESSVIFMDSLRHRSTIRRYHYKPHIAMEWCFLEHRRDFDQRVVSTGKALICPDFALKKAPWWVSLPYRKSCANIARALIASVWLMKGSCLSSDSTAEQVGSVSSPLEMSIISGYFSATVGSRLRALRLMVLRGCPKRY